MNRGRSPPSLPSVAKFAVMQNAASFNDVIGCDALLKAVSMSWLTVIRMMQVKGGFRSPEDLRKTPFNPEPNPKQLEPNHPR